MNGPDAIDEAALQRLLKIGGSELVGELAALFIRNTPDRIQTARDAARSGDLNQVMIITHSLKSSCANLGARRMQQISAEAEKLAINGEAAPLPGLIEQLAESFNGVRESLQQRVNKPPPRARIAVVEDNADNRLLVRALLQHLYDIAEYENGAEALAGIAKQRPDLILLDISLPGMDGYAVLGAIRATPSMANLPVIALTAHAMRGDRDRIIASGFNDYISKPIDDEQILMDSIARLLKA
jgi:CheY-like chemotaxis protein